jgi:hypothetical protein
MTHEETCLCTKRHLIFTSDFTGDTVTRIFCPTCVERAPDDAIIFDLCESSEFRGTWGVVYNRSELKRLDDAFRDTDDYYLSLLISGTCGPKIVRDYGKTGLCRVFGFKRGPSERTNEAALNAAADKMIAADE